MTLKLLVTCCNLLLRRKPENIKPVIVHIYIIIIIIIQFIYMAEEIAKANKANSTLLLQYFLKITKLNSLKR